MLRSKFKKFALCLSALVLVFEVVGLGVQHFRSQPYAESASSQPESWDVAVIFYGSADNLRRVEVGIDLIQSDTSAALLFVGGCRPQRNYFGSYEHAKIAQKAGVPPQSTHIGRGSYDTRSNLFEIVELAGSDQFSSFVFVSSPSHLSRIFRQPEMKLLKANRIDYVPAQPASVWERLQQYQHELNYGVVRTILPKTVYQDLLQWRRTGDANTEVLCDTT